MRRKWTKEKCQEESLKYKNKIDFIKKNNSAYVTSYKNGWLDEICSHMEINRIQKSHWTKENSHKVSLTCKSRSEFRNLYWSSYTISKENKWLDEICSHMKPINNRNRCIYAYIFNDNSVYIGLTSNLKIRNNKHLKETNSSVYKHILKTNIIPELIQLTEYINVSDSISLESEFVQKYKNNNWNILNKTKTGSIGSSILYWTKEKCQKESLKYNNKTDFYKKSKGSYISSTKNGWLEEITIHMKKYKIRGYWNNFDNCLNEAIKKGSKFSSCSGPYNSAKKNGWLEEINKILIMHEKL